MSTTAISADDFFVLEKMSPVFGCIANKPFLGSTIDEHFQLGALSHRARTAQEDNDTVARERAVGASLQMARTLLAITAMMDAEFGNAVRDFASRVLNLHTPVHAYVS